jgi:predicted permease
LNPAVLLFTLVTSVAVGMVFGLLPALKTWKANQQPALKSGGRSSTGVHYRKQSGLVVAQTALTLTLLVGTGLLFRTIRHLWNVNPGFDTHQLISFKASLSPEFTRTPQAMRTAYQQLIERIQGIAGVQSADLTTLVPLSGMDNGIPFWVGQEEPRSLAEAPRALTYSVGPDYFQTMGIPLLHGRSFTPADTLQSEQVGIIDNTLAETYFPGQDPVGQTFTFARVGAFRIVGVVGHVKHWSLGTAALDGRVQVYTSFYQLSDQWLPVLHTSTTVLVRTQLNAGSLMPAVRSAIYGSGGAQPVYDVHTMQQAVSASMATQSFPMILLGAFAGLALLLASVGSYGLLANFVQYRTKEIGVRMALGAQRADVFRMVIRQGLRLTLAGIVTGLVGAFILTRVLSSFSHLLFGIGANDPLTLAGASLLLIATAVLACYIPARSATMVAPMAALRQE